MMINYLFQIKVQILDQVNSKSILNLKSIKINKNSMFTGERKIMTFHDKNIF